MTALLTADARYHAHRTTATLTMTTLVEGMTTFAGETLVESCKVEQLFSTWDTKGDKSQRASAAGVVYLFDQNDPHSTRLIDDDTAFTEDLLAELSRILEPSQSILGLAKFYKYREAGPIPLEHLTANAVWVIRQGQVFKVRGLHQVSYLPRNWMEPYVLVPCYRVHGTTLSFPFLEPDKVHETLLKLN